MNADHKAFSGQSLFRIHMGLGAVVYLLDQVSKLLILLTIEPYGSVKVTSFFNLVLVYNKGVAFGMFSESEMDTNTIFLVINVVITLLLGAVLWHLRGERSQSITAIWMILGGALGNITDRFSQGHVIDFIDLHFGEWHYATFNLADAFISIGAILIALDLFKIRVLFRKD